MKYSLSSYRSIIERALACGYTFCPFSIEENLAAPRIYLRHDIDYSPAMALKLARVNADLGVAGTFFALLHSHTYNVLCSGTLSVLREIQELGQNIGFHAAIQLSEGAHVEARLLSDFKFVKSYFPTISPVFSWHNPTTEVLEAYLESDCVAGLLNAYAARFMRNITYASDSNMRNSIDYFLMLFDGPRHPTLQLLFHPFNWVAGGSNMREVFAGTWPFIIREKEQEMLSNRYYRGVFPSGMPESVLQAFTERWLYAVECEAS